MANKIPVKAVYTGTDVTALGEYASTDKIDSAYLNTGTTANDLVQLDGTAKLPAVDGSNLTNMASGTPEGTAILSTGETGAVKYLREDGDGTSSWQAVADTTYSAGTNVTLTGTTFSSTDTIYTHPTGAGNLHVPTGGTVGQVLTNTASGTGTWQDAAGGGASAINDLTDGYNVGGSVGLGTGTLANDDGITNYNTAVGTSALTTNTTGAFNTASGYRALYTNSSGGNNVAVGRDVLYYNESGSFNTASGMNSLFSNTTGAHNTASGIKSLYNNTTGTYNVALGSEALHGNTTSKLTGSYNSGIGYQTGYSLTTGQYNVLNGYQAGYSLTTGSSNIAIGNAAGDSITSGYDNICIGEKAGDAITVANNTVCIGKYTMWFGGGTECVAIGQYALKRTTGNYNVAVGASAGAQLTSGIRNTAVGDMALSNTTNVDMTGSNNTAIGDSAGRYSGHLTGSYNGSDGIALGRDAYLSASNEMSLGNSAHITAAYTAVAFATRSDERQKDIEDMDLGLDFVTKVTPIKYKWKADAEASDKDSYFYGFSAQDVKANLPTDDAYSMHRTQGDEDGVQNLTYNEMIAPLYKAIQEQQEMIKSMQLEINTLKGVK